MGIKRWNDRNPENRKERQRRSKKFRRLIDKLEILNYYSNGTLECVLCGEDRLACLSIDHIYGGGTKHKKELRASGIEFYTWIIKNDFPEGFRTIYMNCQFCEDTPSQEELQEVYYHTRR
jgi:hypothetical protein